MVSDLTQIDLPSRLFDELAGVAEGEPTLAVVTQASSSSQKNDLVTEVFAGPFAGRVREHGLTPLFCSADEAVLRATRFRAIMLVGETVEEILPLVTRLRSDSATVLTPILAALRRAAKPTYRLLSAGWSRYVDGVLEGEEAMWQPGPALQRLRQIDARQWPLQPIDDRFPEASRRQLLILRWMVTRELDALEPVRDPASPLAFSYAPFDLVSDPTADLDALTRLGLLKRVVVDRVCACPSCDDARLLFREVCAACRSTDVRRGDVVHHYACGHVQSEAFFRRGNGLVCPSCAQPLRHVGIDYERPATLLYCNGCGHAAAEGTTEARCLACGATPLAGDVRERSIHKYLITSEGTEAARSSLMPATPSEV